MAMLCRYKLSNEVNFFHTHVLLSLPSSHPVPEREPAQHLDRAEQRGGVHRVHGGRREQGEGRGEGGGELRRPVGVQEGQSTTLLRPAEINSLSLPLVFIFYISHSPDSLKVLI